MKIGRRPLFFGALALLCLLMLEPTPAAYRWVNLVSAGVAIFWAILLLLEERSLLRITPSGPPRRRPEPREEGSDSSSS